jgi:hypothetical protein
MTSNSQVISQIVDLNLFIKVEEEGFVTLGGVSAEEFIHCLNNGKSAP